MIKLFKRFMLDGPYLVFEHKGKNILVISDLHFGYSNYLLNKGIYSLIDESKKIKEIVSKINEYNINKIVFNGDIIHDFGSFPWQLKKKIITLIDLCKQNKTEPMFVLGNHDVQLKYQVENYLFDRAIVFHDFLTFDDVFITHGDKLYEVPKETKFLILGHEHPAVVIDDNKFKCYVVATMNPKKNDKKVIIMPSFFDFVEGTDLEENARITPYHNLFENDSSKIIIYKVKGKYVTLPLDLDAFL